MSIYVYVTRRHNPLDAEGPSIALTEWAALLQQDASLRSPSTDELARTHPSKSVHSIWTRHPQGLEAWFSWTEGQIDVRNPDEPMIVKALELANALNAHVVSETGELFNEDGSHKGFVDGEPW